MVNLYQSNSRTIPHDANKVFQGEIFSVWQWPQQLYDGSTATFEAIKRADTAHTVGILPDGRILMVEDEQPYRPPVITPAGGVIDENETPEEGAKREFLEETGYQIGQLIPWHSYQPSDKIIWRVHAFIGRNLLKSGEPHTEPGEKIKVLTFTFNEFVQLGQNPMLRDLVLRTILLEAQLDNKKKNELYQTLYGQDPH